MSEVPAHDVVRKVAVVPQVHSQGFEKAASARPPDQGHDWRTAVAHAAGAWARYGRHRPKAGEAIAAGTALRIAVEQYVEDSSQVAEALKVLAKAVAA